MKQAINNPNTGFKQILSPVTTALKLQLEGKLIALALYGSQARGEAKPDSDWDILLIATALPPKTFSRHLYLKKMLPDSWRGQVSLLAKTPAEFEAHLPSLFLDIALDGIILYDPKDYLTERLSHLKQLIQQKGLYRESQAQDLLWQWEEFPGYQWQLRWGEV